MADTNFSKGAPITINTTVIPVSNFQWNLGASIRSFTHSSRLFPSDLVRDFTPGFTFQTPVEVAHTLIGEELLKITALKVWMQGYTNYQTATTADLWALAAGATGAAIIGNVSPGEGGVMMASVTVRLHSSNGKVHPLLKGISAAPASLVAEPQLQVSGPLEINGSQILGAGAITIDYGNQLVTPPRMDGDTYPRNSIYQGGNRSMQIAHQSPLDVVGAIGLDGSAITADVVAYLRDVGTDFLTTGTTGASYTIASGAIFAGQIQQGTNSTDSTGLTVQGLTDDDDTDPFAISFAATLP